MRFLKWILPIMAWLRDLVDESKKLPQQVAVRDTTTIIALIATGLVGNVLATWIAQEMLNYSFSATLVVGLIIILLMATILQVRGLPFQPRPLTIIAVLLTLSVVQSTIIAIVYINNQPVTTYIVFDATNSTIPYYPELVSNIRLSAQVQPPRSFGGLRIFGGQVRGEISCGDTTQLIQPMPIKNFEMELDKAFSGLNPKGNASLTIAVLSAIDNDLKDVRGPVKLIVITSGIDPKCEPERGGTFEAIARIIQESSNKDITIAIIGVGELSETEEMTLESYAQAFGGKYLNASEPGRLSSVLLASEGYFSDYGQNATPTAQP